MPTQLRTTMSKPRLATSLRRMTAIFNFSTEIRTCGSQFVVSLLMVFSRVQLQLYRKSSRRVSSYLWWRQSPVRLPNIRTQDHHEDLPLHPPNQHLTLLRRSTPQTTKEIRGKHLTAHRGSIAQQNRALVLPHNQTAEKAARRVVPRKRRRNLILRIVIATMILRKREDVGWLS